MPEFCKECGTDTMRTPHADNCTTGIQFANDLIRRNDTEAFIAEHFIFVSVP